MTVPRPPCSTRVEASQVDTNRVVTKISAYVGVKRPRYVFLLIVEWRLRREVYDMGVTMVKGGRDVISNEILLHII